MPDALPRPSNDDRIKAAVWYAARGFGIFPVWSTSPGGACRCPLGGRCSTPGKHPVTAHGFQDATTDPARIRTFLSAASEPNYGMICPDGVFAWDLDSPAQWAALAELEPECGPLPPTLRTDTAKGQHVFWHWPDGHPRPIHHMFGMVTRWGSGRNAGYVIGPHSVHPTGVEYRPAPGTFEIATLPESWAQAAIRGDDTVRIGGTRDPADVHVGERHAHLRDIARHYAGTVRDPDALFAAVWTANQKLNDPKSEDEVRRAIGEVLNRFGPDTVEEDPETGEVRRVYADEPPMMSPTEDDALPAAPPDAAFSGLLGDCTRYLLEGTDASPVAVLASLVAFCGALMPAWGYWHGRHTSSPFLALVGPAGVGRKGTAMYRVRDALGYSLGMDVVNSIRFDGIASGEALVKALLDRSRMTAVPTGVLFEEEYATFLAASGREGSNLDSRMRAAFDGKQMAHRKVGETIFVPEPYYLSGLVAITPVELQAKLSKAAFKSGSGNRWLWLPVERRSVRVVSTEPIFPVEVSEALLAAHQATYRSPMRADPGPGVDDLLSEYDEFLRAEAVGLAADMTTRYGVIAFRMGLVHAAVEKSGVVKREHVLRAIALTEYARAGLGYVFGVAAGDQSATHLLRMLLEADDGQLAQNVISKHFIRDPIKRQVAIDDLLRLRLAEVVKVRTKGRTGSFLRLVPRNRDFRDFSALFGIPLNHDDTPYLSVDERGEKGGEVRISSADGGENVRESAQKSDDKSVVDTTTGEVVDRAEAQWTPGPCREYRTHQTAFYRGADELWRCPKCYPEEERP